MADDKGRYSKAVQETQPDSFPPPVRDVTKGRAQAVSLPDPSAPVAVSFSGPSWRVTIPLALIMSAASFFGGRQTAPAPDAQQLTAMQIETRTDIADIKRDIAAIRENVTQRIEPLQNRVTVLELRAATAH